MLAHPGNKDHYLYGELPSAQSIRLLYLHPGDEAAPLVCEMKIVSLEENPSYAALSSVWGIQEGSEILHIRENRKQFKKYFRPSLAGALRRLRLENEDRILWIDALCIHQLNIEERNQ